MPHLPRPLRAPALYFMGRSDRTATYAFRLPSPPVLGERPPGGVRAIERRAKKAYFAVLDAMQTGAVDSVRAMKLRRLAEETKAVARTVSFERLLTVIDAVQRIGEPFVPPPPAPFRELTAVIPSDAGARTAPAAEQIAWPLEWLRTRGYVVSRGLDVRCHATPMPASD